ncbi:hypothetical protein [Streptosporangium sp. V21-05]|uniref:hypothetical protein n=1 Tax=Streptosporangium sp. V21-05 TaxID=3446115 RepID=UPI003F534BFE
MTESLVSGWLCGSCGAESNNLSRCPACEEVLVSKDFSYGSRHDRRAGAWTRGHVLAVTALAVLALSAVIVAVWVLLARSGTDTARSGPAGSGGSSASPTVPPPTTTASPSPESTGDEGVAQAEAIDRLLSSSAAARTNLGGAIADVRECQRYGEKPINDVTKARSRQLSTARSLEVGSLTGGTALKNALVEALDTSYRADAAFGSWARRHLGGGCQSPVDTDTDYRRGNSLSAEANRAKTRFVELWTPIADSHGLPARLSGDI